MRALREAPQAATRWRAILTRICAIQSHAGRLAERDIIARHLTCQRFAPDAEKCHSIVNGAQHGAGGDRLGLLRPGGCGGGGCALTLFGLQGSGGAVSSGAGGDPRRPEGTGSSGAGDAVLAAAAGAKRCIPCRRCTIRWAGCSTPVSGRRWPILRASTIC